MIKALYKIVEALKDLADRINPVCGCMANTSTTVLPAGGTSTSIVYSNEVDDTHDAFDGTTFTVPAGQAGLYEITAVVSANSNDGVKFIVWAYLNGSAYALLGRGLAGSANICGFGGSCKVFLAEGDQVKINAQLYNAANTTVYAGAAYNHVSIYKVH